MSFGWLVDPGRVGGGEDLRVAAGAEALGVPGACCGEGRGPFGVLAGGEAVVDVGGGVQSNPGVPVCVVVTLDEGVREPAGVAEAIVLTPTENRTINAD